ncbi:MAG: S8 family serine peptidase [Gammaproteobacteria bacterium]|nr:S8 family serine peptidase [Gammaproteobacteria bacterium]
MRKRSNYFTCRLASLLSTMVWPTTIGLLLFLSNGLSGKALADSDKQRFTSDNNLLIQCDSACDQVKARINELGGTISREYSSIGALAAVLPEQAAKQLDKAAGIVAISKDALVSLPKPTHKVALGKPATNTQALSRDQLKTITQQRPQNYSFNNVMTGAAQLHQQEIFGDGVVVAVIDSGTANNSAVVPAIAGNVIGGENFVELPEEPSATSTLNDSHGTWVAGMIASHIGVVLPDDDLLIQSISQHAPDSVIPLGNGESLIPMVGSAPGASLYAMKVFPADGGDTPSSIVAAALDRVLTLKRNFNNGIPSTPVSGDGSEDNPYVYDSLNIQVVNMSLGGLTLFAGRELEDLLVLELLKEGVTVVSSAGNEGFAAFTGGSPGTSVASLTVGATMSAAHERILRDLQYGPGTGELFRPTDSLQTAYFSSRGPTADGRYGLQLMANGFAAFTQGADGGLVFVSGTSFSAPTVAGAAALLWQAAPDLSAAQIKDALVHNADLSVLGNQTDTPIDRGEGFTDLVSAYNAAITGNVAHNIPELPNVRRKPSEVEDNIEELGIEVIELEHKKLRRDVTLMPGEVEHFFIETSLGTDQISVELSEVTAELPLEQQNVYFGDGLLLNIVDAPTSVNYLLVDERILEDTALTIDRPQSGIVRIALLGDWTNAGAVSAKITLREKQRKLSRPFASGKLIDEEIDNYTIDIDKHTTQLNFELAWKGDWGHYPTHDIDLIVFDPDGVPYFEGATLDSPERLSVDNPSTGLWTILVTGYMLHGYEDKYQLRVTNQNDQPVIRRQQNRNH